MSGGSSGLNGFRKRLVTELTGVTKGRQEMYLKTTGVEPKEIQVNITENLRRQEAVFHGGSMLADSEHFSKPKFYHTRQDYLEQGPRIARYNAVYIDC